MNEIQDIAIQIPFMVTMRTLSEFRVALYCITALQ